LPTNYYTRQKVVWLVKGLSRIVPSNTYSFANQTDPKSLTHQGSDNAKTKTSASMPEMRKGLSTPCIFSQWHSKGFPANN